MSWLRAGIRAGWVARETRLLWMIAATLLVVSVANFWKWTGTAQAQESVLGEEMRIEEGRGDLVLAKEFSDRGVSAAKERKLDAAQNYWRRSLEIRYRLSPDSSELAMTLNNLGVLAAIRGNLEQAIKSYEAALEIWRSLDANSSKVAGVMRNLGVVSTTRGDLEQAIDYHEKALEILQRGGGGGLEVVRSLNSLGILAYRRGDLEMAFKLSEEAVEVEQMIGLGSLDRPSEVNRLGALAFAFSERDWAAAYFELGLKLQKTLTPEGLGLKGRQASLFEVDSLQGDLEGAVEYREWVLGIRQQLESESLEAARRLHIRGISAHHQGELDKATEYLERALGIRRRLAPKSALLAENLDVLGLLFYRREDLGRAKVYLEEALEIRKELVPESIAIVQTLNQLGSLSRAQGNFDLASQYLVESLRIAKKLAPISVSVASSLENLGLLAFRRGELNQAQGYLDEALEIYQEAAPLSYGIVNNLYLLGELAAAFGELDTAVSYYERILDIQRDLELDILLQTKTLYGLATIRRRQGQPQVALSIYHRALDTLGKEFNHLGGSHDARAGVRARYERVYRATIDLSLELGLAEESFHVLERFRAQSFLAQLAERDLRLLVASEELERQRRQIARLYDQKQARIAQAEGKGQEELELLWADLQRIRWEQKDLNEQVAEAKAKQNTLHYPQTLEFAAAQQTLDPGTVVLSYSVGEVRTRLFIFSSEGALRVEILEVGEQELRSEIRSWKQEIREALPGETTGVQDRFQNRGIELYKRLIEPAINEVFESERLLIIPDGPLHVLPWGALVRPTDASENRLHEWEYLGAWKAIHIALSATVYAQLLRRRKLSTDSFEKPHFQLVAFGDPLYSGNGEKQGDFRVRSALGRGLFDGWKSLPHTSREVERIAAFYPPQETRVFLNADATEEAIKVIGRHAQILHLAAHGFLDRRSTLNSAIVFTIPEDPAIGRDNGLLQVWEIFEQLRLEADLVVLSACSSGLGEEQAGEGLIGLTRAFQYAGARSVIASLWDVRDQATEELMVRFYRYLTQGLSKAEALRAAQLEFIHNQVVVANPTGELRRDYSAPYFWASFQLYGDWQ